MMNIKQIFAAAVFNAEADAAECRANGVLQTAADRVSIALTDLWGCGRVLGHSEAEIQEIADHYVEWDENDEPWPRVRDWGNVVGWCTK